MSNTVAFDYYKTRHAAQRQQQRGIPELTLNLLRLYGHRVYDHRGGCHLIFNKKAKARVNVALGKAAAQINFRSYAVIDANLPTLITMGHLTQRVWVR